MLRFLPILPSFLLLLGCIKQLKFNRNRIAIEEKGKPLFPVLEVAHVVPSPFLSLHYSGNNAIVMNNSNANDNNKIRHLGKAPACHFLCLCSRPLSGYVPVAGVNVPYHHINTNTHCSENHHLLMKVYLAATAVGYFSFVFILIFPLSRMLNDSLLTLINCLHSKIIYSK